MEHADISAWVRVASFGRIQHGRFLRSDQVIRSTIVIHSNMSTSKPSSKFSTYSSALKALSKRTGTPLSSLVLSFGIVHEVTALAPLFIGFYTSRALGVGDTLVKAITEDPSFAAENDEAQPKDLTQWGKHKLSGWVKEGDQWAAKVGTRYGIFGYEQRLPGEQPDVDALTRRPGHLAGDVANAVVAYAVTKVRRCYICKLARAHSASGPTSCPDRVVFVSSSGILSDGHRARSQVCRRHISTHKLKFHSPESRTY